MSTLPGDPHVDLGSQYDYSHAGDNTPSGTSTTDPTKKKPDTAGDTSDATDKKLTTTQKDTLSTEALGSAVAGVESPITSELAALPSEYETAVKGVLSGPNASTADAAFNAGAQTSTGNPTLDAAMAKGYSSPTGSAALNASDDAVTAALVAGEPAIESALGKIAPAVSQAAEEAPYSDVLSTLLTQKKDEILYGETAPPQTINTTGWSKALKDVYSYIQGTGANGLTSTTTGADSLPGIEAAAAGAANDTAGTYSGSSSNPGL